VLIVLRMELTGVHHGKWTIYWSLNHNSEFICDHCLIHCRWMEVHLISGFAWICLISKNIYAIQWKYVAEIGRWILFLSETYVSDQETHNCRSWTLKWQMPIGDNQKCWYLLYWQVDSVLASTRNVTFHLYYYYFIGLILPICQGISRYGIFLVIQLNQKVMPKWEEMVQL